MDQIELLKQIKKSVKAVLFDLDDTLYDHRFSSRNGLIALKRRYAFLHNVKLDELEKHYFNVLNEIHLSKVLTGFYTLDEARNERMRILFAEFYGDTAEETLNEARKIYSYSYEKTQRSVPGAKQLLKALKKKVNIGIVSNNFLKGQIGKVNETGLAPYIDIVVTSEEIGVTKPDPEIFDAALKKLNCGSDEAVMIGDSWEIDISGARNAGIRAIWFNRYGLPCPDPVAAREIRTFEPIDVTLDVILDR